MNPVRRYIVYGVAIDSEFPLATVAEANATRSPATVCLRRGDEAYFSKKTDGLSIDSGDWIQHVVLPDGSIYIRVNEVLRTIVSADGRTAVCAWLDGADKTAFEANFLNFVLSTSLTLQGEEPLHATVIDLGGRIVGLLGLSGAGKSTLAACLIGQGGDLVTDDLLRLELGSGVPLVHTGPYRLKLHRDSAQQFLPQAAESGYFNQASGKILIRPREAMPAYDVPRPLDALFWLGDPEEPRPTLDVTATRLGGIKLARVLIASAMNIRFHAPDRLERQLRFAERVADALPVYALEYPRQFAVMERVAREIRRVVAA